MKILSLDLSTKSSGYCIGEDNKIILHGCIVATFQNVKKRIIKMRNEIAKLIETNKIEKIIMEEVHPDYNSHTYKVLLWLQAAIIIKAFEINPKIECDFIGASSWRAMLKIKQGRGVTRNIVKVEDINYVKNKYNINVNDDEADAICIFDAYTQKFKNEINWE